MDFDTFKEDLAKAVKDRLELIFDRKYSVETHTVEKMNQSYEALVVKPEDGVIGVNIGIDAAFKEYSEGRSFDMIVRQIASAAEHALDNHPAFDLEALTDYSQMKGKLAMEVVSAERNAELLETVPHKNMEDMAIVYRIVLDSSSEGRSSILVTNKMLDNYGITAEQLHADAMSIAPEVRPAVIQGLSEVMAEMMGAEQAEMLGLGPKADEPIFVATVEDKTQGAGILAYQDFMDQAAEKLGGSFYILPSSIHEILLVKDNGQFDRASLEKMVREVNATQVAPEDKLTDSVYHYDSQAKVFELAEKFEAREVAGKEKDSLISDLKAKKEEVSKAPKKEDIAKAPKTKGGEAI